MTCKKFIMAWSTALLCMTSFPSQAVSEKNPNQLNLFLISDPHVDVTSKKTTNINPPPHTSKELDKQSLSTLIAKVGAQVDLAQATNHALVLLGDLPAHNAYSRKTTRANINFVFEQLFEKINPSPYFYVFGNNDSFQRDYGPFTYHDESAADLLKAITGTQDGFLSTGLQCPFNGESCIHDKNPKYGYYSAYLGEHLKLISLNSVLFVSRPQFNPSREGATEALQWLEQEFKTSKINHDQVILAMHVPPQSWESTYKTPFKKIIKTYPETVIGMLAAHSHFDEIHAIKIANKDFVIPIIYSASIGVDHGNASSFKTITLSRQDENTPWQLKNYITYNFIGATASKSQLNQYYDFNQAFCSGTSTETVATCLKKHISKNKFDKTTSTLMSQHYTAGNPNNIQKIDPSSRWIMSIK
ncbi:MULTISPECIES: metallophosphoesterase [Legionella]|uniref:metallophosphoesterase n=1 Tax=Legionella TaxID=445 RepID=UPI000A7EFE1F|nr:MULTISPECIES: metallophosphoesterase [Legionella]